MHKNTNTFIHVYTLLTNIYAHTYIRTCIRIYTKIYIYTHTPTHINTYTYTYTHIYIHMNLTCAHYQSSIYFSILTLPSPEFLLHLVLAPTSPSWSAPGTCRVVAPLRRS